jgi:hypothetical protein
MQQKKNFCKVVVLLLFILMPVMTAPRAMAAQLTQRSVAPKTPIAGAVTDYTIKFTIATPGTLGSIQLQFCSDTPFFDTSCAAPAGFAMNSSTLSAQTGETGFSIDPSSTANNIILTRAPSASLAGPVQYDFTGVTNPSTPNISTYIRVMTYATNDASGTRTDQGAAVFSTAGQFGTAAYVPPRLYFCVGVTVAPNCSSTTGSGVDFGDLKPSQVASVTTQSAAATNDPTGYVIYSLGSTMTSGTHVIAASPTPNPSVAGIAQFGINLRANNNPSGGQDVSGAGTGTAMPNYDTPNLFMFDPGAAIAEATGATDFNTYTSTYIANVPLGQTAGVYVTTITYMAVAQF